MKKTDQTTRNRIILISSVIVAVFLGIGLIIWNYLSTQTPETNPIQSSIKISAEDQSKLALIAEDFTRTAGNFGFDSNKINENTILDIYNLSNSSSYGNYVQSRSDVYSTLKKNFIFPKSVLDYDETSYSSWTSDEENVSMTTYAITDVSTSPIETGSTVKIDGVDKVLAYVDVIFSSKETRRETTATDISWDGTFKISSKKFTDNHMRLGFVQDSNGEWKVYSSDGPEKAFLLVTWKTPDSDAFELDQTGFSEEGTIKAKGVTPGKEPTPTSTPTPTKR